MRTAKILLATFAATMASVVTSSAGHPIIAGAATAYGSPITIASAGVYGVQSITTDAAGDIFWVSSYTAGGGSAVEMLKKTAGGYAPQQTLPFTGLTASASASVALDSTGDVFVANGPAGNVLEVPKTVGGYGAQVTVPFAGLTSPAGIAIDANDDIFVSDNNGVIELPRSGSGYGLQTTLPFSFGTTAFDKVTGIALDGAGNVYTVYGNIVSGTHHVLELKKSAGSFGSQSTIAFTAWDGGTLAVDGPGDVFVTDPYGAVNGQVLEAAATPSGHAASTVVPFTYQNDTRSLAVDGAGDVFAGSTFGGINELPAISGTFGSEVQLPLLGLPGPIAADAAGDVFVPSTSGNVSATEGGAIELVHSPGGYHPSVLPLTALGYGIGSVAADPAGDVSVTAYNNGSQSPTVYELPKSGNGYGSQVTVPFSGDSNAGLSWPSQLAMDTNGDVFAINNNGNEVLEVPKTVSGFGSQVTLPFLGTVDLTSIAVDPSGDVFAINSIGGNLLELPKTPGGFGPEITTPLTVGPNDITFDSAGNLFLSAITYVGIPAVETSVVDEMAKTVGGFGPPTQLTFPGLQPPSGIAIDGAGDVFAAEVPNAAPYPIVSELPVSLAGVVSPSTSTVTANPTSVVADGATTSTVTVTLKDNSGAPVAGKSVSLAQGVGTHATISAASGVSNASGVVTFSVKDATAEAVTLSATDTTDAISISQTAQVTFTAPLPTTALVVSSNATVGAGSVVTVTVKAVNASNGTTPLYRGTVHLTSSDGAAVLPADHTFTSGDAGNATFPVTFNTAGAQSVTATDTGNSSITGSKAVTVEKLAVTAPANQHYSGSGAVSPVTPTVSGTQPGRTITWSATGLPAGLAIGPSTGTITGTPSAACTCSVTVKATDAGVTSASATFTWTVAVIPHGYWLVGADGGIFTFGSAGFYGSTGNIVLQRPVVGITPTSDRKGYWLVASDGGIFAFGDAGYYGSIPGIGLAPAGTPGAVPKLNAPIVAMVPSNDGKGYFMVASDGGIFAFGDAAFAGSCPGIGGCAGAAVAVMPDATGKGYWLVTTSGNVYNFGDAASHGQPGAHSVPVTSAVRTPSGNGYWILFADGTVTAFGDAQNLGAPAGQLGGANPAAAIFATASGHGYWVASAQGGVYNYGDAPNDGSMVGSHLNAPIIAASGW